ncbi:unnamed protein product [Closterium sp. NIES-64]|nr:unnamed protein product [Closterium sp. NIES-64]
MSNQQWVISPNKALYSGRTCPFIRSKENCQKNGRRDTGYLNWRWQPRGCDVNRLDPAAFLSRYRNKVFAIAGDSFSSNFGNAIRCSLHSYSPTVDFSGEFGGTDVKGYRVAQYNFTFLHISSVYLVDAEPIGAAKSSGAWKVYLDTPRDKWGDILNYLDVFIFSAGHWFVNAPSSLRQYYIKGVQQTGITGFKAMEIAHATVRDHIIRSRYKGIPVMLSFSPFHDEEAYGGPDSGRNCKGAKMPFTAAELANAEKYGDASEAVGVQLKNKQQQEKQQQEQQQERQDDE